MEETEPDRPPSSSGLRIAVVVLAIALAAASAYILQLRSEIDQRADKPMAPAAAPAAKAAPVAPAPDAPVAAAPKSADVLTAAQQQALVGALKTEAGANRKVWFQVQRNNPNTGAVQAALQRAFEEAGWTAETVQGSYPLKSGLFLLAGDDQPPSYVDTVDSAFRAAGIDLQYLTGYRAFFTDRKQQNPNWVGPELAADQAFVLIVGSQPTPRAGS